MYSIYIYMYRACMHVFVCHVCGIDTEYQKLDLVNYNTELGARSE